MEPKEILLLQLKACHNETNWFVTLNNSLKGLTDEQSRMKTHETNHSVREIVNHLIFWNERYLKRLKNETPEKFEGENDKTYSDESAATSELDWENLLKKSDSIMNELLSAIIESDNAKLANDAFKNSGANWYSIIANINIHNAYHIGQIVAVRKHLGLWDSKLGVN